MKNSIILFFGMFFAYSMPFYNDISFNNVYEINCNLSDPLCVKYHDFLKKCYEKLSKIWFSFDLMNSVRNSILPDDDIYISIICDLVDILKKIIENNNEIKSFLLNHNNDKVEIVIILKHLIDNRAVTGHEIISKILVSIYNFFEQ